MRGNHFYSFFIDELMLLIMANDRIHPKIYEIPFTKLPYWGLSFNINNFCFSPCGYRRQNIMRITVGKFSIAHIYRRKYTNPSIFTYVYIDREIMIHSHTHIYLSICMKCMKLLHWNWRAGVILVCGFSLHLKSYKQAEINTKRDWSVAGGARPSRSGS